MAAKGKVPSCGCSIVCSEVCSNLKWFLNLKMTSKGFPMGIPRSGKIFFLSALGKLFLRIKQISRFASYRIMFRNKCAKCEKTWSKCRFIGWEGKSLGRKCYNEVKRKSEKI